jgi:hypothetical protein
MDRSSTPNKPVQDFKDGRLKATVWANEGENGTYHAVTLSKIYEDKEGRLQESHSFTGSELLRIAELAREAHAFTRDLRRETTVERQSERAPERAEPSRDARPKRFENYPARRGDL